MLDDLERRIIHHLQGDLPLTARPFALLAGRIGISEEELIERIRLQRQRGILRRLGANLDPQLAGFKANAMVAWYVPEDKIEEIGPLMANFKEVSHLPWSMVKARRIVRALPEGLQRIRA